MPSDGFIAGNRLFACLSRETRARLAPGMETVPLRLRDVLHRVGRPAEHVYWPHRGMASIVTPLRRGMNIEASTIGNEGLLGISHVLGDAPATEETIVAIPGEASRLRLCVLRDEFERNREVRTLLLRYAQLLIGQIVQGSACNRAHSIEARCAKWLLSAHDRIAGDEFPVTHEFLAMMLGVRRAGVSVAQHKLLQDGLIDYVRGNVRVLSRRGLESIACECYGVLRQRLEQFYAEHRQAAA